MKPSNYPTTWPKGTPLGSYEPIRIRFGLEPLVGVDDNGLVFHSDGCLDPSLYPLFWIFVRPTIRTFIHTFFCYTDGEAVWDWVWDYLPRRARLVSSEISAIHLDKLSIQAAMADFIANNV